MSVRLRVQRVRENAAVPSYKSAGAAGLDLSACVEGEGVTLEPGCVEFIPIGIAIAIEPGYEGQVRPRSGLASKHLVTLPNTPGTIDSDYRGEVFVPLINLGREPFVITPGMRVAQLVIAPVVQAEIEEASSLDPTDRGEGGFGSTGL